MRKMIEKFKIFRQYELDAVKQVAEWYTNGLRDTKFICPLVRDEYMSSWAQYTIKIPENINRDLLQKYLAEHNIPSMVYYMKPMHLQSAFDRINIISTGCISTEKLCQTVLSLPMHPYLTKAEVEYVVSVIKEYSEK